MTAIQSATPSLALAGGTVSGQVIIKKATGNALIVSTDGSASSEGAMVFDPHQGYFAVFDTGNSLYYGIARSLGLGIASSVLLGGYFNGLGIQGSTNSGDNPIFGILAAGQGSEGLGHTAFTILDTNKVFTFSNTLDDGSGGATIVGVAHLNAGTDTSSTATASAPVFVSGTALQLNTTQDTMLYINVTTVAALAVAMGPTSGVANTIIASESVALGLATLRVPKGWFVKITGTVADLAITAVTC